MKMTMQCSIFINDGTFYRSVSGPIELPAIPYPPSSIAFNKPTNPAYVSSPHAFHFVIQVADIIFLLSQPTDVIVMLKELFVEDALVAKDVLAYFTEGFNLYED